jgi:uncharacterized membrane protein
MTFPNDWQIKNCLVLSLGLLLAMLGLIGLACLGFDVPFLRQMVGFLLLTFIPGILLLRILKIHNVGIVESLLYSVGLSLGFIMAVGVVANFALPPLGISRPITLAPLVITFTVFFLILCFLAYVRDKSFRLVNPLTKGSRKVAKPGFFANLTPWLLATLLPLLAILGASLVNSYYNNTLLLALIFIITIIVGVVAFNKFIPPRVYPFMIVMMGMALMYQTTLISSNLVGSDIHTEYYLGKLVVENGHWDVTLPYTVNSCLSIVMLAPIYSLLLNMDIVWLFKAVYPLFFCLAPLALFHVFRLQIKPRYAFLATFFFIAMPMFMMDMAQLCRQQVSELFFVLVILLLVDRKLTWLQRTTLVLIFGFGVVVSHYGMGTGYIGYLVFGALVLIFIKSRAGRTLWQWLVGKRNSLPADVKSAGAFNKKALVTIAGVSLVFMLGYYSVVASGIALIAPQLATGVVTQGVTTLTEAPPTEAPPTEAPPTEAPPTEASPTEAPPTEAPPTEASPTIELPAWIQSIIARFPILDPLAKEPLAQTALGLDFPLASLGGKAWRIFQYLVELCLVIGFFRLIFRPRSLGKFKIEYISLTIVSIVILLSMYVLPTRGWGMGTTRIFQITLLLMAPLFLFGAEVIGYGVVKLARVFRRIFTSSRLSLDSPVVLHFSVLVILIPYFLFNSGVVFELSRSQTTNFIDVPYSIAVSSHRVELTTAFTKQDTVASGWLSSVDQGDYLLYADYHSYILFYRQYGFPRDRKRLLYYDTDEVCSPSYIYLRTWNTQKRVLTNAFGYAVRQSVSFADLPRLVSTMAKSDRIYNSGKAQILLNY